MKYTYDHYEIFNEPGSLNATGLGSSLGCHTKKGIMQLFRLIRIVQSHRISYVVRRPDNLLIAMYNPVQEIFLNCKGTTKCQT